MKFPRDTKEADDFGLGLIELLVGILVSTIVLIGVGTILVNSWLTQSDVLSTSEATNRGQLVSSSVEKAMRNALFFDVRPGGTELVVHTSFTGNRQCQAFHLADDIAEMKTSEIDIDLQAWGTWLEADTDRGWQALVAQSGSTPFFVKTGETLTYTFDIETDSAPVRFRGEASTRSVGTWGSSPCW
jgi:Tfp pilus assembly protein PilW